LDLEQMKAVARIEFEEIYSKGRIELIDEILADDYVCHDPALPEPARGKQGLREAVIGFRTALPDLHFRVDQQVAEGDRVVTAWTATGTHTGDLMGVAGTGRRVTMAGVDIERFEGDKIVEVWALWDALGVYRSISSAVGELG
jgi:steroid delta-isomerase-like uncharacterized protein